MIRTASLSMVDIGEELPSAAEKTPRQDQGGLPSFAGLEIGQIARSGLPVAAAAITIDRPRALTITCGVNIGRPSLFDGRHDKLWYRRRQHINSST
jgi:hypothetical protein